MAGKFYAVRVGKKPGIYLTWDEAKVLVNGYPGAIYKSFKTREEAEEFMQGSGGYGSASVATSNTSMSNTSGEIILNDSLVSKSDALRNLMNVEIKNIGNTQAARQVLSSYETKINDLFEDVLKNPVDVPLIMTNERVLALQEKYGFHIDDDSTFAQPTDDGEFSKPSADAIFFVDGGGDKSGAGNTSNKILFGAVWCDLNANEIKLYRGVLNRGEGFDWLFRMSNVAGEELGALLAMYIAKKHSISTYYIYQDNNLPAKYFTGEFKRVNNEDDYMLMLFVSESAKHLEAGHDIRFVYVPSEHSKTKTPKQKKEVYEKQPIKKLPFENAEFLNGISDALADFNF